MRRHIYRASTDAWIAPKWANTTIPSAFEPEEGPKAREAVIGFPSRGPWQMVKKATAHARFLSAGAGHSGKHHGRGHRPGEVTDSLTPSACRSARSAGSRRRSIPLPKETSNGCRHPRLAGPAVPGQRQARLVRVPSRRPRHRHPRRRVRMSASPVSRALVGLLAFRLIRQLARDGRSPYAVRGGPFSELPRAAMTASASWLVATGHPCGYGASLRVPSRWTTTVQARVR